MSDPDIIKSLSKIATKHKTIVHYQHCKEDGTLKKSPHATLVAYPKKARRLMHQKVLAVDEKYGWVGTANYTTTSLHKDTNVLIGCKSPELSQCIIQNISGSFTIGHQPAQYFSLPKDKRSLLQTLFQRIQSAQKTIQVAMWGLTHILTMRELQQAQQRGVRVEVVIDNYSKRLCLKRLKQNGCTFPVYCKATPFKLHCKICVIDHATLMIGSVNWSQNGFILNSENLLILDKLTPKQKEKLEEIWCAIRSQSAPIAINPPPSCSSAPKEEGDI